VVQFLAHCISMMALVLALAGPWELQKAPRHHISDVLHPPIAIVLIVNVLDTHFETTPTSLSLTGMSGDLEKKYHSLPMCLVRNLLLATDEGLGVRPWCD
jgi:hypothetical protein